MELTIAKEKYDDPKNLVKKMDYSKWVEFINNNNDYFIWLEKTKKGKERLSNIDKIPEGFRTGILEQLNKKQAYAEFNEKKGWHEIVIDFNPEHGFIRITIMKDLKKINKKIYSEMANYLDGLLLRNGTELIDEATFESLS